MKTRLSLGASLIATAIALTIGATSASASSNEGTCKPFSKSYEWKYSTEGGSLVLDQWSWDAGVTAQVTVAVTNNEGNHNATLSFGKVSVGIERNGAGTIVYGPFALPGGVNYVPTITSTDGWSSQITFTFDKCQKPAPTTTAPAPTTTTPAPTTTVPAPTTTVPVPEQTTTTVSVTTPPVPTPEPAPSTTMPPSVTQTTQPPTLPATGSTSEKIAALAGITLLAGIAMVLSGIRWRKAGI